MNEKYYIINRDKDIVLKNLTSNNYMEFNLGNLNMKERIKNESIKKYSKNINSQKQKINNLYLIKETKFIESKENQENQFKKSDISNIFL